MADRPRRRTRSPADGGKEMPGAGPRHRSEEEERFTAESAGEGAGRQIRRYEAPGGEDREILEVEGFDEAVRAADAGPPRPAARPNPPETIAD